ncbi:amidohydrolase family protein [Jeongeupia sp. USM3]|uniref:amidohydrolase family protein n=1 Tax=Jeongeupia sp. USM3 TaxID=1906741 RepID=UPI0009F5EB9D|nr:amidohydrolase family protein [Jeongeupia sp. USM3]
MEFPRRIVDMHTHLFNARYMPLASIITDAMNKKESALANRVAEFLEAITGSSYKENGLLFEDVHFLNEEAKSEYRIDQIWEIAKYELLSASGSRSAVTKGASALSDIQFSAPTFNLLRKSNISSVVDNLSDIDFVAENYVEETPASKVPIYEMQKFSRDGTFGNVLDREEQAVRKSLRAVIALMDSTAWGAPENYLEFFLTMLKSEEDMFAKLIDGYGPGLPSLQVVHFMMDMQMAYPDHKSPRYPFFPNQVEKMEQLHRNHPTQIFGFCAFDPRRPGSWKTRAEDALARGFIGFKFYPPLGYKPSGNKDKVLQSVIDEFFDFCVDGDIPVFAHCTPKGFQTRLKEGGNAHPKYWRAVLEDRRWNKLRLCLGHAGGARIENNGINSPGWMSNSDEEWRLQDNFARIVTELCTSYPNVYCEVANMSPLLNPDNVTTFVANLERARTAALSEGRPFELMDKLAYGTDWHMPDMVDNTRRYFEVLLNIMNRNEYRHYIDKFFWQNAYSFMKIPE